ncbi:MAG: DUF2779 domain-containing protein, partial [Dehalococcoidia bacterium]|nr:DUF2779 domain-containing protein [Dehalococcoidia bacterium]
MLSKSRYLYGLQCPRLLWIVTNEPERIPEPDTVTQYRFDQGKLVGKLAKRLFSHGVELPTDNFMQNILMTKELLRKRKPVFEAGVISGRLCARTDILSPVGDNDNEWDIIEVKSSTSAKEIDYHDVAFQRFCWEQAGVRIRKCFIACINSQYVRYGEVDPKGLFSMCDVSEKVLKASKGIRDRVASMLETMSSPNCPEADIGQHCNDPYDCPIRDCWEDVPEHNVFTLYSSGRKSRDLYELGMIDIRDIPSSYHSQLNEKQRIQCRCVADGKPYADTSGIREFLGTLEYPLYYLDFETFATPVPI